jgi:tetratricopeptide (TPR) repeat protein
MSLVFLSQSLFAQSPQNKDSLYNALQLAKTDIKKIDVLNALAYEHKEFDDSNGFYYSRQALALAKNTDYPKGLQYAYTMVGVGHFSFGNYIQAIENFNYSHAIPLSEGDLNTHLYTIMLTGNVLADIGKYDSAQRILEEGLQLAKKNKHNREASIHKSLARMQARLWQNQSALKNIKMADSIRKDGSGFERADISSIYATIYLNQSDLINAEKHIQNLCTAVDDKDDYYHKSLCHLLQSEFFRIQGQYGIALKNAFQALEITEIYSYPFLRAQIFLKIGLLYSEMSEYSIAIEFLFRALKITEKSGIDPLTAEAYAELGWIFKEQKNYRMALDYVDQSQTIRDKIGDIKGIASSHNYRGLI